MEYQGEHFPNPKWYCRGAGIPFPEWLHECISVQFPSPRKSHARNVMDILQSGRPPRKLLLLQWRDIYYNNGFFPLRSSFIVLSRNAYMRFYLHFSMYTDSISNLADKLLIATWHMLSNKYMELLNKISNCNWYIWIYSVFIDFSQNQHP